MGLKNGKQSEVKCVNIGDVNMLTEITDAYEKVQAH